MKYVTLTNAMVSLKDHCVGLVIAAGCRRWVQVGIIVSHGPQPHHVTEHTRKSIMMISHNQYRTCFTARLEVAQTRMY